jgi:hypothetical protein
MFGVGSGDMGYSCAPPSSVLPASLNSLATSRKRSRGGVYWEKCQRCGRVLTDPISLGKGIGPECWDHIEFLRKLFAAARERLAIEAATAGASTVEA